MQLFNNHVARKATERQLFAPFLPPAYPLPPFHFYIQLLSTCRVVTVSQELRDLPV